MENKVRRLFLVLSGFFIANALLAEFIGVKLFSLEQTFGYSPVNWKILGIENLSFNLTAGVLLWPFVFVLTDIVNEYFGTRGVRLLSFLTAGLIGYAFLMILVAMHVTPAGFWVMRDMADGTQVNMQQSFNAVFGQGMWIIVGSLTAFLVGQLVDVYVFHYLRAITGHKKIWLRATGSTLVSQFIDSFVVLYIAFHIGGPGWPMKQIIAIMIINYIYKVAMALLMTPVIYLVHYAIDSYLGKRLSEKLTTAASFNKA
ncbi:MAG: VUT family protein [Sphingobacteriales bacterium]|nr:MAG: VUT family protein [Sphingobacteriales bacterium]